MCVCVIAAKVGPAGLGGGGGGVSMVFPVQVYVTETCYSFAGGLLFSLQRNVNGPASRGPRTALFQGPFAIFLPENSTGYRHETHS